MRFGDQRICRRKPFILGDDAHSDLNVFAKSFMFSTQEYGVALLWVLCEKLDG